MRFLLAAVATFIIASSGCPTPVAPVGGAGCAAACANALNIEKATACGLHFGEASGGVPCEAVCNAMLENGVNFDTGCAAEATSCASFNACSR